MCVFNNFFFFPFYFSPTRSSWLIVVETGRRRGEENVGEFPFYVDLQNNRTTDKVTFSRPFLQNGSSLVLCSYDVCGVFA